MFKLIFILFSIIHLIKSHLVKPLTLENLHQFKDPCTLIKCERNEVCVAKDMETANCLLKSLIEIPSLINKRQLSSKTTTSVCTLNECGKYGKCEITSVNNYKCHCDKYGIIGFKCDMFSSAPSPCSSNPCWGNSECINLNNTNYECKCKYGRSGLNCIGHIVIISIIIIIIIKKNQLIH